MVEGDARRPGFGKRLGAAALGLVRFAIVVASLVVLVVARTTSPYLLALAVVAVALALGVLGGRRARPWLVYVVLFAVFVELRGVADETGVPVRWEYVVTLDSLVPYAGVPTIWLQQAFYTPGSLGVLDIYVVAVYLTYFLVPHLFALILWRFSPDEFRRYATAVLAALYAGLVVCFLVPTAPPWLAGQTGHLPPVARVVEDAWNPELYRQGYEVVGINPVAAMPSLHTAVTVVVAIFLWRYRRVLGLAGVVYAASMAFALVYSGEHYVVDVLAGLAVAAGAAWVATSARARAAVGHTASRIRRPGHPLGEPARERSVARA